MAEKLILKVDDGSRLVEIHNVDDEVVGEFRFNPTDFDIMKRFDVVINELEAVEIPDIPDTEDEESRELIRVIDELSEKVKKSFDYLLNYKTSDEIFAKCNPFTITSKGNMYCEDVIEGIANLIKQTMDKNFNKRSAKIKKATAKYHK